MKTAETCFLQALDMSHEKEKDLETLYSLYKKEGYPEKIYRVYQQFKEMFVLSPRMEIATARALIDLGHYNQAQRILNEVNDQEPTAEAYYWSARIAEKENDWGGMELAIQKATVLDPATAIIDKYFLDCSKGLEKLKRLKRKLAGHFRIQKTFAQSLQ